MITLRLDPNLEDTITQTAKNLGMTKSELIRKSIVEYLGKIEPKNSWETGKDLFGRYSSGLGNLSKDRKKRVRDKIKAKRG